MLVTICNEFDDAVTDYQVMPYTPAMTLEDLKRETLKYYNEKSGGQAIDEAFWGDYVIVPPRSPTTDQSRYVYEFKHLSFLNLQESPGRC